MYMENKSYQEAYQFIVPSLIALGVPQQEIDDLLSPLRYGFTKAVASFTGREDILKQIDQLIKHNNAKAYRVVLHAAAGTGKSEIVRRYVVVYGKHFNENVIWLKSESEDSLNKAFIELAEQLNLEIRDEHQNINSMPTIIASVYGYLDDIEPLFVFDDAWEFNVIKNFLPPYNKYTALITSQKKDFPTPDFEKIAVKRLTVVESKTLLTEQCRANLTNQHIKDIDDLIQGHPLGLQQVISALNNTTMTSEEFIELLKSETANVLKKPISKTHHGVSTIAAIEINLKRLSEQDEDSKLAIEILNRMCYLRSEEISMNVVRILDARESSKIDLDSALHQLESASIINKRNTDNGIIVTIHSLIQATVLTLSKTNEIAYLIKCLKAFFKEIDSEKKVRSIHHVDFAKEYFNHFFEILTTEVDDESFYKEMIDYVTEIKDIAKVKQRSEAALTIIDRIITKCELSNELDFIAVKNSQAIILKDLERCTDAIKILEEILSSSKVDTINMRFVLAVKSNLASFYQEIGNHKKSLEMHEEVYKEQSELYGEYDELTLITMHNLMSDYSNMSDHEKAISLGEKVISNNQVFGENNEITRKTKTNLANDYLKIKEYSKAIDLSTDVMNKRIHTLGENHEETLEIKYFLAHCYRMQNDYIKAIEFYTDVMNRTMHTLGENHEGTLNTKFFIADCYRMQNDYIKAIELFTDVMNRRIYTLGENHEKTLNTKCFLADCYRMRNDYIKAIELYTDVMNRRIDILGKDHQLTLLVYSRIISLQSRDIKNAEEFEEILISGYEKVGHEDKDMIIAFLNLASTYRNIDKIHEAIRIQEIILSKQLDKDEIHKNLLAIMNSLANDYCKTNELNKAIALHQKVLENRIKLYPEDPEQIVKTIINLASDYGNNKDYLSAVSLLEEQMKWCDLIGGEHNLSKQAKYILSRCRNSIRDRDSIRP
uniref:NB-ARC domain-containing protein n=2 Tax=Clytia hemisphaerica TaxID=252671 RepID=A0A7M5UBC5_9CNID